MNGPWRCYRFIEESFSLPVAKLNPPNNGDRAMPRSCRWTNPAFSKEKRQPSSPDCRLLDGFWAPHDILHVAHGLPVLIQSDPDPNLVLKTS